MPLMCGKEKQNEVKIYLEQKIKCYILIELSEHIVHE